MTDRVRGFYVTLDRDIREDDAGAIRTALQMTKHVIDVSPDVADPAQHVAEMRVRAELSSKLIDVLHGEKS